MVCIMEKLNAEQTLFWLIKMLLTRLDELNAAEENGESNDFIRGEKAAYIECLEIIRACWDKNIIPDNIEEYYPI